MKTTTYQKSGCLWSAGVMGFLDEMNVPYEIKNFTANSGYAMKLRRISEQCKSPTLELDGQILVKASVEEVAEAS